MVFFGAELELWPVESVDDFVTWDIQVGLGTVEPCFVQSQQGRVVFFCM